MTGAVAVLSFLPDAGHVFPLLRVAASFANRGYDVVCYLPQECRKYLKGYDFRFAPLAPAFDETSRDAYKQMLLSLSRKPLFYNAVAGSLQLSKVYWDPLMSRAREQLASVRSRLDAESPLFLLCDGDHIFDELYSELSRDLSIPLVLHTPEGHRWKQNFYVHTYGVSSLPIHVQLGLARAMHVTGAFVRAGVRLRETSELRSSFQRRLGRFSRRRLRWLYPRRVEEPKANADTREPAIPSGSRATDEGACLEPLAIATGSGYLEQTYLSSELEIHEAKRFFAALRPPRVLQLSPELREWLEEGSDVVYVSFGSMVHLDLDFVRAILTGLSMLNLRVLWSMPKAQQDELLPNLDVQTSARFTDFVPPLEVLTLKTVRCGINHGGAGSVQDCLLSGKPMLVIPVMWDQPYNGSVVSRLGVGKRLWRRRVSAKAVTKVVESLLYDERFASRAANLARELERRDSEAEVAKYILDWLRKMTGGVSSMPIS